MLVKDLIQRLSLYNPECNVLIMGKDEGEDSEMFSIIPGSAMFPIDRAESLNIYLRS